MKQKNKFDLSKYIKKKAFILSEKGFVKNNTETFTAINLGESSSKGLIVKQGKIVDYFIEEKKEITEIIDSLKKNRKIEAKNVRVSVKNPACLIRCFSFPKTNKKELQQALYYQLNKLIPYSPDEVYFDYMVLKEINSSQIYILLAAAKKSYIDSVLEAFRQKGISISEITLDSISLMNLYLDRYQDSDKINSCILDIGHSFSTINILEKGSPFISREAKFSAKDIIEIITRVKSISGKEAVDALSKINKKSELFTILEENIADWGKEIKNSFDFFELNKGQNLDKLYITGGLASIPGITDIFSANLGIDSEILIPDKSNNLKFSDQFSGEKYKKYKHNLAVSFGLIL